MSKNPFAKAEISKLKIAKEQKKEISALYEKWAKEIESKYHNTKTNSGKLNDLKAKAMAKSLRLQGAQVAKEVEQNILNGATKTADAAVKAQTSFARSLGFKAKGANIAFGNVDSEVVESIATGSLYGEGWSLSKRIWGDAVETQKELQKIVAGGIAQNKSVYEIAQDLSGYVNPKAAKNWNLKDADGRKIYPRQVDYNAQRLARTMSQHAYQQAVAKTSAINPMITGIRWVANGSRPCEICEARDGKIFSPDNLPLDHPNGFCVMEPVMGSTDDIVDQLAAWYNAPEGTYPEMDKYAAEVGGYKLNNSTSIAKAVNKEAKQIAEKLENNGFDAKLFTDEEKAKAYKTYEHDIEDADRHFRDKLDAQWNTYTSDEKFAIYDYTVSSSEANSTLSGYQGHFGYEYYKGLDGVCFKHRDIRRTFQGERTSIENIVSNLTNVLDKSILDENVYVKRGSDLDGLTGLFTGSRASEDEILKTLDFLSSGSEADIKKAFEGQLFRNDAFTSTTIKRHVQFDRGVEYTIYAPKGTKAMYVEPQSLYGGTSGTEEYKVGQSKTKIGEAELLVQRGTTYKVTNISKNTRGDIKVDMEIVQQPTFKNSLDYADGSGSYKVVNP